MSVRLPDADVAERERRRAADLSIGEISGHVEDRWPNRALLDDVDVEEAWTEASPVHYPSAHRGAVARYHRRTDTVLLARQGGLVTCIELMDRPWSERIYIRNQVIDQ
ncbi:hypothetical protein [Natronobacterium gregoryi]|uniref:RelE toxin-related domain-containing protein n=2 Tax=Natronobacterium gregoryi TaxID=44930 RepID=L0AGZ7_NATGS|nr:hypothetical protein [Natronobacterium gregoryi]AFZ73081.1 hypothetical protein Natgr_1896 [Natronobacterium gregoryi SP2]ELY70818.1 hypothetical protein C490_05992 [Natronobacterium gregoryi SP2]PLK20398.1 hypothetical protein CYV19_09735 [Natronobacterium gregoryi SP2]SFI61571.1 hypothetical protein SAMN05443661_102185 [Natronobacterium gregoryi]